MYDLPIPVDARVEHGTKLASTLRAHHGFALQRKYFFSPVLLQHKVTANGFELSGVLIRYFSSAGGSSVGERVGVRMYTWNQYIYALVWACCTCVIVLVMPYNCGFVFLSSHFVLSVSKRVSSAFSGCRQSADRRQTAKMFEVVRSSLPWSAFSSHPLTATSA